MAKRRPTLEPLEDRLCMAAPTFQASINLPATGSWTPTPYRASPILADIFNTGKDNLITVTTGAQLVAYSTAANGSLTPVVVYQVPGGVADIKSTPIVVTNPATGRKDLFAGMGRNEAAPGTIEDGRVFGWDLQTGQLLPGWTQGISTGPSVDGVKGVYGALTSGALEGNGMPDIVATSFSSNVIAIRLDGSVMWSYTNDDTIVSGAVIGDIDRTGLPSVILGGDSSASPFFQAGGWVNVLSNTGALKWRKFIPGEVTWSSPTLADLNNNGYLDIVIGTGLNFDLAGSPGARAQGNYLYALDPLGNVLPGWPYHLTTNDAVAHEVLHSVAVADLLGNGLLDVVAIDRAGYLHAIAPNGTDLPGFAGGVYIPAGLPASSVPDDYASPIIADINGDGRPEIVAAAGPFLRAFNSTGQMVWSVTTPQNGYFPNGTDAAAAVGYMNGGTIGTLATVSYNPNQNNRPDVLSVYSLPSTTLAAPWPTERRISSGDAVMRSPVFDHAYVAQAFQGAFGFQPAPSVVQAYNNALDSNTFDLSAIAYLAFTSPFARQYEINRAYQTFLGRGPSAGDVAGWSNYLTTGTVRNMDLALIGTTEFASSASNNLGVEITRLYQGIVYRTPNTTEINYWIASKLTPVQIATLFLYGQEGTIAAENVAFDQIFGYANLPYLSADSRAAFAYDYHRGVTDDVLMTRLLANGGNYAVSNFQAAYTQDIYRDLLHRQATPAEVAYWVGLEDSNTINISQLAGFIINSDEARALFIQQEFQTLLGRPADQFAINGFLKYTSRENLILAIVGSSEYITHNGGTIPSYISAVARDLAGISPVPQSVINDYSKAFAAGTPLITLAKNLMSDPNFYFTQTAVNEIMQYLPDQAQGVLRIGKFPTNTPGQPLNPSPALIHSLVAMTSAGMTDEQAISSLLTSPTYTRRVTYFKGIYRSAGVRI